MALIATNTKFFMLVRKEGSLRTNDDFEYVELDIHVPSGMRQAFSEEQQDHSNTSKPD